jgi:Zn-dependent M28 family amino/carboxypeptidase
MTEALITSPPQTREAVRECLREHVTKLAGEIGVRNVARHDALCRAAEYIEQAFTSAGYEITRYPCEPGHPAVWNIEAQVAAREPAKDVILIGAHYDTDGDSPGANDNGSGVAAMLTLARMLADDPRRQTLRFVAFVNEENPFFHTGRMGSYQYARLCRRRSDRIRAMICLETIGYYSSQPNTQKYIFPLNLFYPSTADFIGFVSNWQHRSLAKQFREAFRMNSDFPVQVFSAPECFPGVAASDHWSFWQFGYPAVMITDTTNLRYRYFHTAEDTPDKLEYESFAAVVEGLAAAVREIVRD